MNRVVLAGIGAFISAGLLLPSTAIGARPVTLHVQAGSDTGGDGTRPRPFTSLKRLEAASRPGDRLVVLRGSVPLDGGIRLKRDQTLRGAGPRVTGGDSNRMPWLTNTTERLEGDAVRLAGRTRVRNLRISGSARGGIYGRNVKRVKVIANKVTAHNTACTQGFHIPPFNVPTTVPGVGIPISDGLHNGWAAIMVDADRRRTRALIRGNLVRDASCGDGIDVRASGEGRVRARIIRNRVKRLRQGQAFESILAIGLQTTDRARMTARLHRNHQRNLGNEEDPGIAVLGADTEGVFINPGGNSRLDARVTRNHYSNPANLGGFSANGLEFVAMGDGARAKVLVGRSEFSGTPGDVIEQLALGTNAHLQLTLRDVSAHDSTGFAGTGFGHTVVIPGNNGDCLIAASGGAGNVVETSLRRTELTGCANNGLTFGSAVANGSGPSERMTLSVHDSVFRDNNGANLRVTNLTDLDQLSVRVEDTDLSNGGGLTGSGFGNVSVEELGSTGSAAIDLGGGGLGSRGGNCLHGGLLAAEVIGYDVVARHSWWGQADGPGPVDTVVAGGSLDSDDSLPERPKRCS